jgi:hypothetical protein
MKRGRALEVFTDANHLMNPAAGPALTSGSAAAPAPVAAPAGGANPATGSAAISVTSPVAAAEIEVDGAFVGNTPTALHLAPGSHRILVKHGTKVWERTLQVTAGSTVSLNAILP